jgi:cytochrome c biogenesis protein
MRGSVWSFFSRMNLTVWLILALACVAAMGTLFPQMPYSLDAAEEAAWLLRAQERYGTLTHTLNSRGIFQIYRSGWFVVPYGLLMLNTLICTLNRLPGTWRAYAKPRTRLAGRLFQRMPHHVTLPADSLEQVRRDLTRRGFAVRVEREETSFLYADRFRLARLGTLFLTSACGRH